MGIGHVAVGLALKKVDLRINAGWLVFTALLPDFLLGWFVLAGCESYALPADYPSSHYLLFTFPWSHGLLADLAWAAIAGSLTWSLARRINAAVAIAIAVLSHFLLDGIVHVQGLPLVSTSGPAFGLGLWHDLPLELSIEAAMAAAGLWIYWLAIKTKARPGIGMVIYIVSLTAFLVMGQAGATATPPRGGLIASWLIVTPLMAAIAGWLDSRNHARTGIVL
jgi:hypothetical protein